jgi:processive 1,2-diacylglycerol beta-glucosyltransferase
MIVHSPIPGQEEHNADYLLEEGVALKAIDGGGMEFRLKALLADSARLARLARMRTRVGAGVRGARRA